MDDLIPSYEEFEAEINSNKDLNYEKKLDDTKYLIHLIQNKWEEIAGDIDTEKEKDEFTEVVDYVNSQILKSLEALQDFINNLNIDDNNFDSSSINEIEQIKNYYHRFRMLDEASGGIKRLVGKDQREQLTKADARKIGRMIANMEGEKKKKYIATMNYLGASCGVFTEMRNAFNLAKEKDETEDEESYKKEKKDKKRTKQYN